MEKHPTSNSAAIYLPVNTEHSTSNSVAILPTSQHRALYLRVSSYFRVETQHSVFMSRAI